MQIKSAQVFYPLEKAGKIAKEANRIDEDGWSYEVVDCKNGLGRIDVYDEEGELVWEGFGFE